MIDPHHIRQAIERTLQALALSTTKPGSRGGLRVSGGENTIPAPLPDGVMWGKRLLTERARGWAAMIGEEQQIVIDADPDDISVLAWLHKQAHHIAAHEEAQQFLDELEEARQLIENPYLPRQPARFLGVHGGGEVHVRGNKGVVELSDGRVELVESIQAWNRDQVRLYEGTAKEVSEMIWVFFGEYINPRRITLKHDHDHDGRYKPTDPLTTVGKAGRKHVYRVQDVLRVFEVEQTKTNC